MVTNVVAALLFSLYGMLFSNHAPDVRKLVLDGRTYIAPRIGYLLGWPKFLGLLGASPALILPRPFPGHLVDFFVCFRLSNAWRPWRVGCVGHHLKLNWAWLYD